MPPTITHPLWLLLLPLAVWVARRRPTIPWPSLPINALAQGRTRWLPPLASGLNIVAFAALTLALADARWGGSELADGAAVVLLVDASGSMAERDFPGSDGTPERRWDAVRAALTSWLPQRSGDLIGLILFARQTDVVAPLTADHAALLAQLQLEQPRQLPTEADTNLGDALALALARLETNPAERRIVVLVSDGEHNAPAPALTPGQAARLAASAAVPVVCIDVGGASEAGRAALTEVARISGGRRIAAGDGERLAAAFADLGRGNLLSSSAPADRRPLLAWLAAGAYLLAGWLWRGVGGAVP